jgi:signal transduction histidine kinase/CheY-like chemotaxis protein
MAIPIAMLYFFLKKGKAAPFRHMWWLYVFFILSCGFTHLMEFVATWYPAERLAGVIKLITAIISWMTVIALFKLMPQALRLKTPGELEAIVEQRTLELQLKTAELETALRKEGELTAHLRNIETELRETDRQRTHFLAMLAHELRNPLAPVRTTIHIIREKYAHCLDDRFMEMDAMINRQLTHLSRMIDDLMDVARITHGKVKLDMGPVHLSKAIQGALTVLESHKLLVNHYVDVQCDPETCVLADATRLEQIFTNLLHNALKYTPKDGSIWVSVSREDDKAHVIVSDNGSGINEEDLPRIFDLFFQSDQSIERRNGGLGLGLTIVKRMMDLHGAKIAVESKIDVGTTFHLYFRILSPDECETQQALKEKKSVSLSGKKRMLIVEDNKDAATSLSMLFEEEHEVEVVHDGNSAVVAANLRVPDVVILDIGLPGLNGFDVARALRSSSVTQNVKIIAVSGYSRPTDINYAKDAGIDHYLVKPVEIPKLKKIVLDKA